MHVDPGPATLLVLPEIWGRGGASHGEDAVSLKSDPLKVGLLDINKEEWKVQINKTC